MPFADLRQSQVQVRVAARIEQQEIRRDTLIRLGRDFPHEPLPVLEAIYELGLQAWSEAQQIIDLAPGQQPSATAGAVNPHLEGQFKTSMWLSFRLPGAAAPVFFTHHIVSSAPLTFAEIQAEATAWIDERVGSQSDPRRYTEALASVVPLPILYALQRRP